MLLLPHSAIRTHFCEPLADLDVFLGSPTLSFAFGQLRALVPPPLAMVLPEIEPTTLRSLSLVPGEIAKSFDHPRGDVHFAV